MNKSNISVLLVDDHALILQGLKHVVSQIPEISEVYTASTASEALSLFEDKSFDVCILDLELPDMNGFDLIGEIRKLIPDMKILINTMHEESWMVKRMFFLNVNGVVLKSADTEELVIAIRRILNGGSYFCNEFSRIKKRVISSSDLSKLETQLTNRELDVLTAIYKGLQTREIAELLHVSVNTVESHRKNLFFKLGVRNSVELVVKAMKNGLINLDSDL